MKSVWITLTIVLFFSTGLISASFVMKTKVSTDVDLVMVNEILKTLESHWAHIEQGDYTGIKQPFAVLDNSGNVLYQTEGGLVTTINAAIKNRLTIIDVYANDALAGKLILQNDYKHTILPMKKQLVIVLVVTFTALTVLCALYMMILQQIFFKPFKKLQDFALNVARGHLDIPLQMNPNNPFGAFTESFDIMREQLAAARQSEYAANRSKKELIASLSHDIKTPVASIKAVSELMLLRAADDKVKKQINTIYSKAGQIDHLVTDMFHATLEELKELKVEVAEELSDVINDMIVSANYDDQISWEPIPACMILTDKIRLQQVLDNIISNSYKYAGTPIHIASVIDAAHLKLSIMDYGNGIQEDELPLLFTKYYRGTNVRSQGGAGLGLYLSSYFMKNMQGEIECHNREDGFTVTLNIKLA